MKPYPFWEPSSTVSTSPSDSRTGNVHVGKVLADDRAVREAVKVTSMTRMSAARNICQNSVHVHQGILAIEQGGHEVDIPSDSARPHIPELVAHRLRANCELRLVQRVRVPLELNEVVPVGFVSNIRADVIAALKDCVGEESCASLGTREALRWGSARGETEGEHA